MSPRISPAQLRALDDASPTGSVSGHRRTMNSLLDLGLIEVVPGWVEVPATRYHRASRSTERVWGVAGYKISAAGADTLERSRS